MPCASTSTSSLGSERLPRLCHPEERPVDMVDCKYVIYGKIIIDDIAVKGTPGDWGPGLPGDSGQGTPGDRGQGDRVRSVLGGGGPQAAFGARLWSDSVGFLSRSGGDLAAAHIDTLHALDVDLAGWSQFPDIP